MSIHVFVAMSGGVDSSVSAHLLKEAGYQVSGIHLRLFPKTEPASDRAAADLEETCRLLQIPLHYVNLETDFKERVITYFLEEYRLGHTPNPCIRCNQSIKFGLLLEKVRQMGGDFLATGHYARIENSSPGLRLLKGIDRLKDQSYFLYILNQLDLAQILFPVGGLNKAEVKQLAASLGLPAANHKESQDICFIPGNDSRAFLSRNLAPVPGEIVDIDGKVLGQHPGLAYYTVGQRQGMGVSASERLYVIQLDTLSNRLVIGPQSHLFKRRLTAGKLNWISGQPPESKILVTLKFRYRSPEVKGVIEVRNNRVEVEFAEPQKAIAPGQSVVFYQEDLVLGGGIIEETA